MSDGGLYPNQGTSLPGTIPAPEASRVTISMSDRNLPSDRTLLEKALLRIEEDSRLVVAAAWPWSPKDLAVAAMKLRDDLQALDDLRDLIKRGDR